jgi:hypothetical protein
MRTLLLAVAVCLIALDGYIYGRWTNRWEDAPDLAQAAARLPSVAMTIGDWQATVRALGAREARQAGFQAYFLRQYQKGKDGDVVTVMLACGPPGPLSVHTPDICFDAAGFDVAGKVGQQGFAGPDPSQKAEFCRARFTKKDAAGGAHLQVFWSWHAHNAWQAPANPRWTFAGLPVVHKLYVTHQMARLEDDGKETTACAEFMGLLLPELERTLFEKR